MIPRHGHGTRAMTGCAADPRPRGRTGVRGGRGLRCAAAALAALLAPAASASIAASDPPAPPAGPIPIGSAGTLVTRSGTVVLLVDMLPDPTGAGAVRIEGDNLVIDFQGALLSGRHADALPDSAVGTGVSVHGRNITIRNLVVRGYHVGISASDVEGLVLEDVTITDGWRPRLRSTPEAEDLSDWIRPHENDQGEWRRNSGAGIAVSNSRDVTLRRITVRGTQNGILLENVRSARVYDNDCSFLSGWGLALWRTTDSIISRNAFDFCIRGYSHGVYNRGQDSAGILLFEQCSRNVFAENSATHCGDGIFAFSGREALGEVDVRKTADGEVDLAWYRRRGNTDNVFVDNDLSFAAAHGLECTFGFGSVIAGNRFEGNAICGIWGGYSQDTLIRDNDFIRNGDRGYGLERGGVNIEHGIRNRITANRFADNLCGVHLWWDDDGALLRTPWARANHVDCCTATIDDNHFNGDRTALHLRDTRGTTLLSGNRFDRVPEDIRAEGTSPRDTQAPAAAEWPPEAPSVTVLGERTPVGARRGAPGIPAGRAAIVMTEWGPHDWSGPVLVRAQGRVNHDFWRVVGLDPGVTPMSVVEADGDVRLGRGPEPDLLTVFTEQRGVLVPYTLRVVGNAPGAAPAARGVLFRTRWSGLVFPWRRDPRTDEAGWRDDAATLGLDITPFRVDFPFGSGGPLDLPTMIGGNLRGAEIGADRFGLILNNTVTVPPGRWRLRTLSDDGIRVRLGDRIVIEDWTHHAPRIHTYDFDVAEEIEKDIRVEWFEIDGYAILRLEFEYLGAP